MLLRGPSSTMDRRPENFSKRVVSVAFLIGHEDFVSGENAGRLSCGPSLEDVPKDRGRYMYAKAVCRWGGYMVIKQCWIQPKWTIANTRGCTASAQKSVPTSWSASGYQVTSRPGIVSAPMYRHTDAAGTWRSAVGVHETCRLTRVESTFQQHWQGGHQAKRRPSRMTHTGSRDRL